MNAVYVGKYTSIQAIQLTRTREFRVSFEVIINKIYC